MARHIGSGLFLVGFGLFFFVGGLRNTWAFSRMALGRYGAFLSPAERDARVQRAHQSMSTRVVGVVGGLIMIAIGLGILFSVPPFKF